MLKAPFQRFKRHRILILWLILVSGVFWASYLRYTKELKYFYLREILGYGFVFSRAMASVVNISCFVVILPMCRSFTTCIRILGSKASAKVVCDWIDASRSFHMISAFTILIAGSIHTIAHVVNALNFSVYYNSKYKDINVAKFKGEDPMASLIGTVPGITGLMMIAILFILSSASVKYIRNVSFDLFWFSHHLFIIFFILLICHPMRGLLKEQINILSHPPGCLISDFSNETVLKSGEEKQVVCQEMPIFISQDTITWKWVTAGLSIYAADLGYRFFKRWQPGELMSFQLYNCNVMCIKVCKQGFIAKPGQYVYLQHPNVSTLEWHPFSISKCPTKNDSIFTIHLRTYGDWSECLKNHLLKEIYEVIEQKDTYDQLELNTSGSISTRIFIDGPYGSCFEDVLRHSVSICIAGGIGFTPFASFLQLLRHSKKKLNNMRRLHILWICREVELFKCFSELLQDAFHLVWNFKESDKFEFQLYLTKEESSEHEKNVLKDTYLFLKPRLKAGRPNWSVLFQHWAEFYRNTDVGLFCCGPQGLSQDVKQQSETWNQKGCNFSYHYETFS